MRRRRDKTKVGFIFFVLVLSLTTLSVSYSTWTKNLKIQGQINTLDDFNYLCMEGYWALDETSGSNAPDSSMNENDGTVYGATWTAQGINGCLSFDGSGDYVDLGNTLSLTTDFTVMAWVKPATIGIDMQIISKGYDGTDTQWELKTSTADGKVDFRKWTAGVAVGVTSTKTLTVDTWVHLAGTYDGTTWRIYWNGVLDNQQDASGPVENTQNLYIGAVDHGGIGAPAQFWNGLIDEVKIYSCCLSADDILEEFNAG